MSARKGWAFYDRLPPIVRTDDVARVLTAEVQTRRLTMRQARALGLIWRSFRITAKEEA